MSDLVGNPEDRFSRDAGHLSITYERKLNPGADKIFIECARKSTRFLNSGALLPHVYMGFRPCQTRCQSQKKVI